MIKVLIVDDEVLIRNKLLHLIDWNRHGFKIIGEAANGIEAINLVHEHNPDILIFDISMPMMDGIELSDYINKNYPYIKMIAISSYDDYKFVRQVMKNGAIDYLLKHRLNGSDFLAILLQIKSKMNYLEKEELHHSAYEITINENLLKKAVYQADSEANQALFERIGQSGKRENIIFALINTDNYIIIKNNLSLPEEELKHRVLSLMKSRLDKFFHGDLIMENEGEILLVFDVKNIIGELELNTKVSQLLMDMKYFLQRCYNINSHYEWKKVFLEKPLHQEYKDIIKGRGTRTYGDVMVYLPIAYEERLLHGINQRNSYKVCEIIDMIVNEFIAKDASLESFQILVNDLIDIINKVERKKDKKNQEILNLYAQVKNSKDVMNSIELIKNTFSSNWLKGSDEYKDTKSKYLDIAKEYILRNIANKIMSLDIVAQEVGISPQYLSKIFGETHTTYVDFVNHERVERALKMMGEGQMKVKDISNLCGFNSYNHFYKVFKQKTGLSPAEYRKIKN